MPPCPKTVAYRSPAYLSYIRTLWCAVCGARGVHAHHEPLGKRGMAIKPPDSHAVPLCPACHRQRHDMGTDSFWGKHNLDPWRLVVGYLTGYLKAAGI